MFITITAFVIGTIKIENGAEAFYLIHTFLFSSVHNICPSCFYELHPTNNQIVYTWPFYYNPVLFMLVRSLYKYLNLERNKPMLALSELKSCTSLAHLICVMIF